MEPIILILALVAIVTLGAAFVYFHKKDAQEVESKNILDARNRAMSRASSRNDVDNRLVDLHINDIDVTEFVNTELSDEQINTMILIEEGFRPIIRHSHSHQHPTKSAPGTHIQTLVK